MNKSKKNFKIQGSGSCIATVNNCCMIIFFSICFSIIKLRIQHTAFDASISPSPYSISPACLSFPLFCLCAQSLNYIYSCMSWLIYNMNILIRRFCWDPLLYGALNLYSWPWMHILRCVMMEQSCPATQGYRGNNICYVCISWNEPVSLAQDDTLTQMKKKQINISDLCVAHGGFWSSSLTCDADLT